MSSDTAPGAGQGRLAQVIATRGGLAPPEAPFVIEHREALIYMLCEAAELEHGIMCQYLFAAFSLKQATGEGLTEAELASVGRWRRQVMQVATQEMLHLALVQNLLSAVGAAPHLTRPNLPQPASHYPAGVRLALLPFGEQALRHFMFLERPEGMELHDADGLAAFGRAAPVMDTGDIVPRGQDFATVGHLYRSIEAGFAHLAEKYGERWLFVGPPRAQATQAHFGWPELVAVTDLGSAQRAIDTILEQGEGPRGEWRDAHFGQFVEILDEFEHAREANRAFDPVRPVLAVNVRPSERDPTVPLITDPVTARVVDLFNVAYEILLQVFERFFAHTEETDAQLAALAEATIVLMQRVIGPLGDLITTLPAGPGYPGRTAGPSFELFYESDYLLPHRDAAWALLTERLHVAGAFCESIRAQGGGEIADRLAPVWDTLGEIAQTLAGHLPAGDPHALAPPAASPLAAGQLRSLLARAGELAGAVAGRREAGDAERELARVFDAAYAALTAAAGPSAPGAPPLPGAVPRLVESVLRPLAAAVAGDPARLGAAAAGTTEASPSGTTEASPSRTGEAPPSRTGEAPPSGPGEVPAPGDQGTAEELVWAAAIAATRLRVRLGAASAAPPELMEATAALQALAAAQAPAGGQDRLTALWELQGSLPASIRAARNGPYLVTNVRNIRDRLGQPVPTPPQVALCRCGGSSIKPYCDGTHSGTGFSDAKDPKRVPDRRNTYHGQQVTIFDNRGICQHSGFCTDRLAAVFRAGKDPFVAPSGGRMDEIIRAVRDCPSGALGLAIDGQEARGVADRHGTREPAIEITRDGPYRVTGGIALAGSDGGDMPRAAGASREHYALCRCGHSQNKPFCSGMHWYIGFRDPAPVPGREPALFEWAGGLPALTRMTRLLYEKHVPADPLLAPVFADMPPRHPEREARWLAGLLGGPAGRGEPEVTGMAARRDLTGEQSARWAALARQAAQEAGLPTDPEFRAAFTSLIEWAATAPAQAAPGAAASPPLPRWDWSPAGPPDTSPVSPPEEASPAEEAGQQAPLPGPGEAVSFAAHIKPLFRERDRRSMLFALDLWSCEDVRDHAAEILDRLRNGSMPCDAAWATAKVAVFERWAGSGCQP